jgi:hypothetical protein
MRDAIGVYVGIHAWEKHADQQSGQCLRGEEGHVEGADVVDLVDFRTVIFSGRFRGSKNIHGKELKMSTPEKEIRYETEESGEYIAYLEAVLGLVEQYASKHCPDCQLLKAFAYEYPSHMGFQGNADLDEAQRQRVRDCVRRLTNAAYARVDG